MSRTFRTVGSGNTQSLEPIENNKIPIYETKAAAEADIANLSDGQIIATKDEGNENAKPVDVVEKGNLHAVTSNAVADVLDWNYVIVGPAGSLAIPTEYNGNYEYDVYDYKYHISFHGIHISVDGNVDLGNIATNHAGLSNDFIQLRNDSIGYTRESTSEGYRIAYRQLHYTAL